MERRTLESSAANYPYLQGLYAIPFGLMFFLSVPVNLDRGPSETVSLGIIGGGLLLGLVACLRIARYYKDNYGEVTPTRSRHVRQALGVGAWVVLFSGGSILLSSPDQSICVTAATWALGMLAYCAIVVGVRAHHVVVWGSLLVVGLLPIWGGLGVDRDAVAAFPIGLALIASGLMDHRLLMRTFGSLKSLNLENSNVGG